MPKMARVAGKLKFVESWKSIESLVPHLDIRWLRANVHDQLYIVVAVFDAPEMRTFGLHWSTRVLAGY